MSGDEFLPKLQNSFFCTAEEGFKKSKKLKLMNKNFLVEISNRTGAANITINQNLKVEIKEENHNIKFQNKEESIQNPSFFDLNHKEETLTCIYTPQKLYTLKFLKYALKSSDKEIERNYSNIDQFLPTNIRPKVGYGFNLQSKFQEKGKFRGNRLFGEGELTPINDLNFVKKISSKSFDCGLLIKGGTIDYKNKSKYKGGLIFGRRHGEGKMSFFGGEEYKGEWLFDKKHGHGEYRWTKNKGDFWPQRYLGTWLDDRMHGFGILEFSNGERFEGVFEFGEQKSGEFFDCKGKGGGVVGIGENRKELVLRD